MKIEKVFDMVAMIILIGFTGSMTVMAMIGKGGLIYFYESNFTILIIEVVAGLFAVLWGFHMILR